MSQSVFIFKPLGQGMVGWQLNPALPHAKLAAGLARAQRDLKALGNGSRPLQQAASDFLRAVEHGDTRRVVAARGRLDRALKRTVIPQSFVPKLFQGPTDLRNSVEAILDPRRIGRAQRGLSFAEPMSRAVQREQGAMRFRYGYLAPDHPLQIYIDNLASRIPVKNGFQPRFFLLPDWKESNAVSFPDGTIFLSLAILKNVPNEAALLGVMTHEYVHAYRCHVEKQWQVEGDNFVERVLKRIGLARLHEYEADMRGGIALLNQMGISPIPFKHFLEDSTGGDDLAHGSNLDRALNIATAVHLVDLRGMEAKHFKPIPEDLLQDSLQPEKVISYRAIVQHPRFSGLRTEAEAAQRRVSRSALIDRLTLAELPEVIAILWNQIRTTKGKDKDPDDPIALQKACDRFVALALSDKDLESKEYHITALTYLWFFSGVDIFTDAFQQALSKYSGKEQVHSFADLELVRGTLDQLSQSAPLPFGQIWTSKLWSDLLEFVQEEKFVEDSQTGQFQSEWLEHFLTAWPKTLAEVSSRFDTTQPETSDDFVEQITYGFVPPLLTRYPQAQASLDKVLGRSRVGIEGKWRELAQSLAPLAQGKIARIPSQIPRIANRLLATFVTPDLQVLGRAIAVIHGELFEMFEAKGREDVKHASQENYDLDDVAGYIVAELLKYSLNHFSPFTLLPQTERDLIVMAMGDRLVFNIYLAYSHEAETASPLNQKIQALLDESLLYRDGLNLDQLELIYRYLFDADYFKKRLGTSWGIEISHYRSEWLAGYAANYLATLSLREIPDILDQLKAKGLEVEEILMENPQYLGPLQAKLADAIESGEIGSLDFATLLRMSAWIANPNLQAIFQRFVKEKFWRGLGFAAKLDAIFPPPGQRGILDGESREIFVEEEMQTTDQFRQVIERGEASIDDLLTSGSTKAGLAVLLDIDLRFRDVVGFLHALLTSGESDRKFKTMVYEFVETRGRETLQAVLDDIESADAIVRVLSTLDTLGKQLLLRKFLVGAGGALVTPAKKSAFLNMLFQEWVVADPQQSDLASVLNDVKQALAVTQEWEPLYFALQSVLAGQIAIPPEREQAVPWLDIYEVEEDTAPWRREAKKRLHETFWGEVPAEAKQKPWEYKGVFLRYGEDRLHQVLAKQGMGKLPKPQVMTPLRFVKEAGSRMGSIGVRFLQLLPLIVELKPEYAAEFAEVYDRVQGQSKLAALTLLEREWPQVWDELGWIGNRIGGGSVVTVYEAINSQGDYEVIKVRNPNIHYHLDETYRFAILVLDKLIARTTNGSAYQAARLLLDDIYAWVKADIDFEGFLEQDEAFKAWTESLNLSVGGYRLYVPRSKEPASPYFSREEKITGINLTEWQKLVDAGHDMRAVVSLLAQYYVAQIANGRVLSDIHIGNNAVTEDGRVAIYDRNYYLNLSEAEKRLAALFLDPFAAATDLEQAFYDYLRKDGANEIEVKKEIAAVVVGLQSQDWLSAQRGLMRLKQLGVKMPLHFTLILKNFQALQRMAQQAGFNNLFEAFAYRP